QGGGVMLARAPLAWAQKPLPVPVSSEIFWVLLLLVALLWPLDVATRRITLSPRQLVANAVALATERRARDLEVAVPEELARLRARVASTRRRTAAPPLVPDVRAEKRPPARPPGKASEPTAEQRRQEEALSARLL